MLQSKLLTSKINFIISTGESIVDLISSSFNFGTNGATNGITAVNQDEVMRPDVLSEKLYATQEYWDVILKFNGISNPFSLDFGEILFAPSTNSLERLIVPPTKVVEKGSEPPKKNESALIKPKSKKDKQRLASIRTKVSEVVPPNVNLSGAQNVKVVNGKVILGGDMTQTNTTNINQSINRARIANQLKNNTKL
jgi:hypothetical protein